MTLYRWLAGLVVVALTGAALLWTASFVGGGEESGRYTPIERSMKQAPEYEEVSNPARGMYEWLRQPPRLPGWTARDIYWRDQLQWGSDLEQARGDYDFTSIENGLAEAQRRGGRFFFRIMPYCPGCGENLTPSYVPRQGNGAPDWNSRLYIDAYVKLMTAIGKKYGNDPRLGYIDVGAYGMWGEWYCDESSCGKPITDANAQTLIRGVVDAFPHKFVLMGFDERLANEAMRYSSRVGVRYDCVGGFFTTLGNLKEPMRTVWKRAPVVGEWCNKESSTAIQGIDNVRELHISMLSSGNYPRQYNEMSPQERTQFKRAYVTAGYRYGLTSVKVPRVASAGTAVSVETTWENRGVAPTYDDWVVEVRLRDTTGVQIAASRLPIDLKDLASGRKAVSGRVELPDDIDGFLSLSVIVRDSRNYLSPMALGNVSRQADGGYEVGTLAVHK